MANITHVMSYGDQIGVHYDDGTVTMAVPTDIIGMWLASTTGGAGPGDGTYIWPFPPSTVSSEYGPRDGTRFHEGIDFAGGLVGGVGTAIPAIANGTIQTNTYSSGFGNYVIIDHGLLPANAPMYAGQRCRSLYAHMNSRPDWEPGQGISQSQTVGPLGNTGNSFGAHLHLEIHIGANIVWNTQNNGGYRSAVNPRPFLDAYL